MKAEDELNFRSWLEVYGGKAQEAAKERRVRVPKTYRH